MFNPCYEHCYLRYGKEYTKECDDKCDYAKVVKENKEYKEKRKEILNEIRDFCIEANNRYPKKGKLYAIHIEDLKQLVRLIKKMVD